MPETKARCAIVFATCRFSPRDVICDTSIPCLNTRMCNNDKRAYFPGVCILLKKSMHLLAGLQCDHKAVCILCILCVLISVGVYIQFSILFSILSELRKKYAKYAKYAYGLLATPEPTEKLHTCLEKVCRRQKKSANRTTDLSGASE